MLLTNAHSSIYNQTDCFAFFFRHTLTLLSLCSVFKARQCTIEFCTSKGGKKYIQSTYFQINKTYGSHNHKKIGLKFTTIIILQLFSSICFYLLPMLLSNRAIFMFLFQTNDVNENIKDFI